MMPIRTPSLAGRRWAAALVLTLLWTGCARPPAATPTPRVTPLPPIALVADGGSAVASGKVVPAREATLSFPTSGQVAAVDVAVGDLAPAGALLVALDAAAAEAAVAQAQAALFRGQAQLEELRAGARPQEIEAAQARLAAAQARLDGLSQGERAEEIAAARAALTAARARLDRLYSGPREEERIQAKAALSNAEAALRQAQAAYDGVAWRNDVAMLPESRQLHQATNDLEAARARFDALYAEPDADQVADAQAQVQQAQASLDRLLNPATASQIAEAEAQVRSAQAELELLQAGARDETLAIAAVAVAEAEAVLRRAQADLAHTRLTAPFTGTVTALNVEPGETVLPGQALLTLADLDHLQVETTDLSERDVARVAVGQPATVLVEALNTELPGRVARIAPQANIIGGDVVYAVTLALDEQPPTLRWGMSVEVEILAE